MFLAGFRHGLGSFVIFLHGSGPLFVKFCQGYGSVFDDLLDL